MKLKHTILYVEDVPATISFYERALGLERSMLHQSGDYGELSKGNTSLSFSSLKFMAELGKSPAFARSPGGKRQPM